MSVFKQIKIAYQVEVVSKKNNRLASACGVSNPDGTVRFAVHTVAAQKLVMLHQDCDA